MISFFKKMLGITEKQESIAVEVTKIEEPKVAEVQLVEAAIPVVEAAIPVLEEGNPAKAKKAKKPRVKK